MHLMKRGGRAEAIGSLALLALLAGCTEKPTEPRGFGNERPAQAPVQQIFNLNCTTSGCHGATNPGAGLSLVTWDRLIQGSRFGEVIIPFRPEDSHMIDHLTGVATPRMPLSRDPLSAFRHRAHPAMDRRRGPERPGRHSICADPPEDLLHQPGQRQAVGDRCRCAGGDPVDRRRRPAGSGFPAQCVRGSAEPVLLRVLDQFGARAQVRRRDRRAAPDRDRRTVAGQSGHLTGRQDALCHQLESAATPPCTS